MPNRGAAQPQSRPVQPAQTAATVATAVGEGAVGVAAIPPAPSIPPEPVPIKRSQAHYLWAVLNRPHLGWVRGVKVSPTGLWWRNPPQTKSSISASVGEYMGDEYAAF